MKHILLLFIFVSGMFFPSCIREDVSGNTPESNFESLWKIIDEQYCFLDYKNQEYGLDWNEVHSRYAQRITPSMTSTELFEVLSDMVNELRDGHVNLSSALATSQYRAWFDSYPRNFSDSIQSIYLKKDYVNSSRLTYQILENNIGYIYCSSFSNGIGDGNLDQTLYELRLCDGLIVDVRNNGGGNLTTAQKLAARFTNEKTLVGYMCHKTGPGHNDFSTPKEVYIEPSDGIRWQKKVAVLTNRRSYSATNDFVNSMKQFPNVTIIGDKTGGGSGLPFSSEIPNGWSIRFSASPMFDPQMNQLEFGIDPDVKVDMTTEDIQRGKDTIIETACNLLKK
ncbi:S41 family peptidase [uncultured Phocaeicola sp.]|uniref:S41 family peptidase n=1 Tax=uncultured Phocaeicola sp. TaxID=990718 RepID=UPI0030C678BB